ncbi:T9SS type A sorting domain-containing protein [Mesonia maritima]|uniref:Secretion system C-terminal sorting domain-containing protein n=1 Tax=Mesonia maritima TaxID=1793873 RepID=A0ABU1K474_9FLAO|nr:T9SS type A sorting domain-containing protein [Mesonia maritima]MDR6300424.1 hypothetical protein [Mesonia maritima]
MKKTIFIVLFSIFFITSNSYSQSLVKTISSNYDYMMQPSIESYGNNSVIVSTVSDNANTTLGYTEVLVKMIDNNGNLVWSNTFNSGGIQAFAGSVTIDYDSDGNGKELIVVTGSVVQPSNNTYKHIFILRLNPNDGSIHDFDFYHGQNDTSVFGFDIETTSSGYIVVGSKVFDGPTAKEQRKTAYVFSVDKNLEEIWTKNYDTENINNNLNFNYHNSFNHIIKAENHPRGELYFISGSGTSTKDSESIAAMDLIFTNGQSIWEDMGGPKSYEFQNLGLSRYDNYANQALYNSITNEFYIVTREVENWINILVLDGHSGDRKLSREVILPFGYMYRCCAAINLVNGIDWYSMNDNSILLSGNIFYDNNKMAISNYVHQFLIKLDMSSTTGNYDLLVFENINQKNKLLDIDYDYMVKPITYLDPNDDLNLYQYFYKPKSLVYNENTDKINFVGMVFNDTNGGQNLNFYSLTGIQNETCSNLVTDVKDEINSYIETPYFKGMFINQGIINLEDMFSQNISLNLDEYCSIFAKPEKLNLENEDFNNKVRIFPVPSNNVINISSQFKLLNNSTAYIYDLKGREIMDQNINQDNNVMIDISKIESGIYFIKIINEKNELIKQQRIIKK